MDIPKPTKKLSKLLDFAILNLKGIAIWIKELNFYSRMSAMDTTIAFTDNDNSTEYEFAKGKRLVFSIKGIKPFFKGEFTKKDGLNEITFWLDLQNTKALKDFLDKNINL